jgi:hypothetical protein
LSYKFITYTTDLNSQAFEENFLSHGANVNSRKLRGLPTTASSKSVCTDTLASMLSVTLHNLNPSGTTFFSANNIEITDIMHDLYYNHKGTFDVKIKLEAIIASNIHCDSSSEEYFQQIIDYEQCDLGLAIDALFGITNSFNFFDLNQYREVVCPKCFKPQHQFQNYRHCGTNLQSNDNSNWLKDTYDSTINQNNNSLNCENCDHHESKQPFNVRNQSVNTPLLLFIHHFPDVKINGIASNVLNSLTHNEKLYQLQACIYKSDAHFTGKCYSCFDGCIYDYDGLIHDGNFTKSCIHNCFPATNVNLAIYVCSDYLLPLQNNVNNNDDIAIFS